MDKVVVFGAGAIGLGLLGNVLTRSNYEIKYVDIDERIVSALHTNRRYHFNITKPHPETITVSNIDGLNYENKDAIIRALSDSRAVFTAAGGKGLSNIASVIREGITERMKEWKPINIICCENLSDPAALLREHIEQEFTDLCMINEYYQIAREEIGFANTIISKMCKKSEINDALYL